VETVRLALSGLVVLLLAAAVVFEAYRLASPSDGTTVGASGTPFGPDGVAVVPDPAGPISQSIVAGDRVVAMLGRPTDAWAALLLDPGAARPLIAVGDPIPYTVWRDGRAIEFTVTATPFDPVAAMADDWGVVVLALAMQLVGIYLFARRPDEPAARSLLVAGTGMFASTVPWALGLQVTDLATGTGFWWYAVTTGFGYTLFWCGALHFALVFPRPLRIASGRLLLTVVYGLPIGAQLVAIAVAGVVGGALAALGAWILGQAVLQVAIIVLAVGLIGRAMMREDDPSSRERLRLVIAGAAVAAVSGLVLWFGPQLVFGAPLVPRSAVALVGLSFPVALAMAIDRHHLFDLDTLVNRSLVYGGLTTGVLSTYALTVLLIGGLIPGDAPYAVLLLGAGAVAVVALPLRDRLQRWVDRLMYGDRDDPDRALRRLGRRLEAALDPQTVLPTLVETVAEATRSPYVAIEFDRDGETVAEAAHGTIPTDVRGPREPIRLPIVYRGGTVARLVVTPRAANEPFTPADERLLADLARQAAPAVEAVRLTGDLRRSREELVTTREEERRRLRRDLHDELGPTLAGSLMKLGAARTLLAREPERATALLESLETDARAMIDDVRRMARDLRPPALDELGLVGVLRQRIAGFDAGLADRPFRVSLDAADDLPPLAAAIEVAALRIASEGLTNAARHSKATRADVRIAVDGNTLVVSVSDDGTGVPAVPNPGVGIESMRERAEELGGSLVIGSPDGGGTTVVARLPMTARTSS
jgi:signal transduction histidine kinase